METVYDERTKASLSATWELDLDGVTVARFAHLVVERSLEHVGYDSWATERMTLEGVLELALTTLRDRKERAAVLDLGREIGDDCLAHLSLGWGHAYVRTAARTVDALATAKAWLKERYPVVAPEEDRQASVTFWSLSNRGPRQMTRRIDVPAWAEIAGNYPASVSGSLGSLMADGYRPERGRLFLWHGQPGTGKTYALRALAWEWRAWCCFHYVTDPERFFGSNATYMLDVVLDEPDDEDEKWRLLILEDTGELLVADAKERTGQGLSRLLNVVDGLIGQGLRVMVLVTTNEPVGRLHTAVSRPGRCAELVEFAPFSGAEAQAWLERKGSDAPASAGTLASLFARQAGEDAPERHPVGFTS